MSKGTFQYIVVGSGAGGVPVAARLVEAGYSVLVLEAGGDPRQTEQGRNLYDVPAFHPLATEHQLTSWGLFVDHYDDLKIQKLDSKYVAGKGVFYPREGGIGGCTAHNAMIFLFPDYREWDFIASVTGDSSWKAVNMRKYAQRLEDCRYRPVQRFLNWLGVNLTGHGFNGWLTTQKALPLDALADRNLVKVLIKSARAALKLSNHPIQRLRRLIEGLGDPNDQRLGNGAEEGIHYVPLTTANHQRKSARERLLETAKLYPDRLTIELNSLVTRVIFNAENRAIGVEYRQGERLYRASCPPSDEEGELHQVFASEEVILSGGAFNTPQLLMLSGIGPRQTLERHGIKVLVDLPVGKNLMDRCEVGVVHRMNFEKWASLAEATFGADDPLFKKWQTSREGLYTSNGSVLAIIKRSFSHLDLPDLFIFAILGMFKGYYPNWSVEQLQYANYLTLAILKAHTLNGSGEVTLRSADPRDMPLINFRYFDKSTDPDGLDLKAVVAGIRFVRELTRELKAQGVIAEETWPGEHLKTNEELANWVISEVWGHHASCTCPIKPRKNGGVLTSDFRPYGTHGLRVVDASVFPRIPGMFILSAILMTAEKAADVIIADAN